MASPRPPLLIPILSYHIFYFQSHHLPPRLLIYLFIKLVLGLGVNDSVAFAKGEATSQIKGLPAIDKVSALNDSTPLTVLREV